MLTLSRCLILASCVKAAAQEDANTVFVRENGTVKLPWPLFIGEDEGRSSLTVRIKKNDAVLCMWAKASWVIKNCDPEMNLTISPKNVRVPGPTNFNVTFSYEHKGRADDGTYECHFLIDDKWDAVQIYRKNVTTVADPKVTLNVTNVNASKTAISCLVSGGLPRPSETILIKNGIKVSQRACQRAVDDTDDSEKAKCSSVFAVDNSGGRYKCRVEHAGYFFDSLAVDLNDTRKAENARSAFVNSDGAVVASSNFAVLAIALIANALVLVY